MPSSTVSVSYTYEHNDSVMDLTSSSKLGRNSCGDIIFNGYNGYVIILNKSNSIITTNLHYQLGSDKQ